MNVEWYNSWKEFKQFLFGVYYHKPSVLTGGDYLVEVGFGWWVLEFWWKKVKE